ncbi:hypothetical protein FALBO_11495 [Fusarium albosuccineum]|uniref:Prion-inhibition and propagation HeLo domain-containing protein n=1 Tax=Fusarium albosuccineum TaxID=1237068 RepID=A0A8H4L530_9HYPO|nr:hypothetical protein FALBO_11495 [Fusarium albosuccineum]
MSHRASDAASLAISTVTLIELFKVCLKAFGFVCRVKVTSRSMQELVSQINIERHRLAIWGRRWGLSTRSPRDIDHDLGIGDIRQIVQNSLTSIEMAVCDLEIIQSKYGLSIATATRPVNGADIIPGDFNLDPTHHSAASRQTWKIRIEGRQRMLEKMNTASYSFNDEEKLSQLAKTISWHVQRLWDLLLTHMMPGIERQLVSEVLASVTTESELRLVRSVTEIPSLRQHTDNDLAARDLVRSATEPGASTRRYTMRHRYGTVKTRIPARDDDPLVMADFLQADLIIGKGQKQQRTPVLLEWRRGEWPNEFAPQKEARVNNLAVMLSRIKSGPEADSYRVLECLGYFEDVRPNTFGIFYRLPSGADPTECPVSLNELLMEDNDHLARIPSLDARIKLARCLAISLHELHSSGWLHKQICSQNIVFFKSGSSAKFTGDRVYR